MREVLEKLVEGNSLSKEEALVVFEKMAQGEVSDSVAGGILCALRMKGEKAEELGALAEVMLKKARILNPQTRPLIDIVGTGGDNAKTLNISTLSALICAAAGLKVAKHGNRTASGLLGSADLLEHLGLKIDNPPHLTKRCIEEIGFGFLFAPPLSSYIGKLDKSKAGARDKDHFQLPGAPHKPRSSRKTLDRSPYP